MLILSLVLYLHIKKKNKNQNKNHWQTADKSEMQVSTLKTELLQKMISSLKQIFLGHSQWGLSDFKHQAGPEMSLCLSCVQAQCPGVLQPWESHITRVGFNVLQQKCRKATVCLPFRRLGEAWDVSSEHRTAPIAEGIWNSAPVTSRQHSSPIHRAAALLS